MPRPSWICFQRSVNISVYFFREKDDLILEVFPLSELEYSRNEFMKKVVPARKLDQTPPQDLPLFSLSILALKRRRFPMRTHFSCRRNSIPPTTTLDNLKAKAKEAYAKTFVDVAFWGGVIPGNQVYIAIELVIIIVQNCLKNIGDIRLAELTNLSLTGMP